MDPKKILIENINNINEHFKYDNHKSFNHIMYCFTDYIKTLLQSFKDIFNENDNNVNIKYIELFNTYKSVLIDENINRYMDSEITKTFISILDNFEEFKTYFFVNTDLINYITLNILHCILIYITTPNTFIPFKKSLIKEILLPEYENFRNTNVTTKFNNEQNYYEQKGGKNKKAKTPNKYKKRNKSIKRKKRALPPIFRVNFRR